MRETILIIIFLSIMCIFIIIHKNEVSFEETYSGEEYIVRNLNDKKDAAEKLDEMKRRLKKLIYYIDDLCDKNGKDDKLNFIRDYNSYIIRRFDNIIFRENTDNSKFTSYSINKGEEIVFCLRSRENGKLHDINELMYVAIHELAHVGCPEIGHTPLFKNINIELLKHGVNCNVYMYKDYNMNPEEYCGIELNNNILN